MVILYKKGFMYRIHLKNSTGKRYGRFVRYEYGEDLFGYIYLDVIYGKTHKANRKKSYLFHNKTDFIRLLDLELYQKENLNYVR